AAYDSCVGDLLAIEQRFLQAISAWNSRNYRAAEDAATQALGIYIFGGRCGSALGRLPPNVAAALDKERTLIQDAEDVIKQIE
ncbi:hypothetical protein Ancab_023643, partial [Ancistrocladus abbreviatus]